VFEARRRQYLRATRARALGTTGALVAAVWGLAELTTLFDNPGAAAVGGIIAAALLFAALLNLLIAKEPAVPVLHPVFSQAVPGHTRFGRDQEEALFLFRDALREVAQTAGVAALDDFVAPLRAGSARHLPAQGIACIDELLAAAERLPESELVIPALQMLRSRLVDAETAGARFCLMPVTAWSGAIQTNLGLYFG
jgi:hypothetical protein